MLFSHNLNILLYEQYHLTRKMPRKSYRSRRSYRRGRSLINSDDMAIARLISKEKRIERREQSIAKARDILNTAVSLNAPDQAHPAGRQLSGPAMQDIVQRYYEGRGKYSLGAFLRQGEGYANRFLKKGLPNLLGAASMVKGAIGGSGLYSGRGGYNNLVAGGDASMAYDAPNDETESIVISNCEFLQDVYGAPSASFFLESWKLNPGLTENFPWLAQIAQNYEEYEFIQLLFHFKSTVDASATNNTNGSTGTLIMATNYNPAAPNFSNKETMMQYHGANSGRVTEEHTHGVECDPDKNALSGQKYIRSLPVQVGQDLKTFDLGTFQLAQANLPSAFFNQQIGELWVTYTVRLRKPKLSVALCAASNECRFVSAGGETNILLMGTNPLQMQQNTLPITLTQSSPAANQCKLLVTFPDFLTGLYEVYITTEGTGFVNTVATEAYTGSCTAWGDQYASLGGTDIPNAINLAVTGNQAIYITRVYVQPVVAGVDNTYGLTIGLSSTAVITQTYVVVKQCNPSFAQSASNPAPIWVNASGVVVNP